MFYICYLFRNKNDDQLLSSSAEDPGKSVLIFTRSPKLTSPVNIDSSCSEYSTPPGSPHLEHRNHFHSIAYRSSVANRTSISTSIDADKGWDCNLQVSLALFFSYLIFVSGIRFFFLFSVPHTVRVGYHDV